MSQAPPDFHDFSLAMYGKIDESFASILAQDYLTWTLPHFPNHLLSSVFPA